MAGWVVLLPSVTGGHVAGVLRRFGFGDLGLCRFGRGGDRAGPLVKERRDHRDADQEGGGRGGDGKGGAGGEEFEHATYSVLGGRFDAVLTGTGGIG